MTSNEASIVAFNGLLRAGKARRVHGKPLHVSPKLWRTKPKLLAFRKAGKLVVAVKVPKKARGTLRNAKTVRLSLQVWMTDLSRNQARKNVKRRLKR